ncbi:kynurenine/alpha-aminoadipate aminotransferase, mitochondrial-like [Diadema setosum]|uniref:kynurenine/alpha-aminoadipate aminotransferase, mitochondrial-like n=1 Tax=Diadema setosum TaxID=31175 RepID=UPI003B3A17BD
MLTLLLRRSSAMISDVRPSIVASSAGLHRSSEVPVQSVDYQKYIAKTASSRKPSPIRKLAELLLSGPPTLISLAAGVPNVDLFPFEEATVTLKDGTVLALSPQEMQRAQQYGITQGFTELRDWLLELQRHLHNPPTQERTDGSRLHMVITPGSQHGLSMSCEALITRGDKVLAGVPMYSGAIAIMEPLGAEVLPVRVDGEGLDPDHMEQILSQWDPEEARKGGSDAPRLLYIVPNGDNPTGSCVTLERRKKIYELARKYDIIIMEDDAYYFLQFQEKCPSFLSMDVDGRVLRFDSIAKIISAGLRVGVVTGPHDLVHRIIMHMQSSVLHTSVLTQLTLYKLLNNWGVEGFLKHASQVCAFYQQRRDVLLAAMDKHLTGLAKWHVPTGGMFVWMDLIGVEDSYELISEKAMAKEVLFVPGIAFYPDKTKPSSAIRACFSQCSDEDMEEGIRRLSVLLKEELENNNMKKE